MAAHSRVSDLQAAHASVTSARQASRASQRVVVVDVDVLEELRGMRQDIKELSEKLAGAATRDDLAGYVTREAFDGHLASHAGGLDARRWWLTYGLAIAALVVSPLIYSLLAHVTLALR